MIGFLSIGFHEKKIETPLDTDVSSHKITTKRKTVAYFSGFSGFPTGTSRTARVGKA